MTAARAQHAASRRPAARFIVLTGLSGAGKSQAIRALEDLGYFCVDNLPIALIPTLAELSQRAGSEISRVAIVVDVREGAFLSRVPEGASRQLRAHAPPDPGPHLPRGEPTRRWCAGSARRGARIRSRHDRPVLEGIREERQRLEPIRRLADQIIDTIRPDGPRAARGLHDAVARAAPRARRLVRHAPQLRLQARHARSTPIWCSTSASCRTRTSCRSCARGRAAIGPSSSSWSEHDVDRRVRRRSCRTSCGSSCRTTSRRARAT